MSLYKTVNPINAQFGMTMIEVLVSLVILGTGMLGMMALQAASLRSNQNAYFRTQAVFYASEIAEEMRSNTSGVLQGHYNVLSSKSSAAEDCDSAFCTSLQLAVHDLKNWNDSLDAHFPKGKGIVCLDSSPDDGTYTSPACTVNSNDASKTYIVKIWWDDDRSGTDKLNFVMALRL